MTKQRLHKALACYGALGLLALVALEGPFRAVTGILLAGLAVKSWVAYKKEES